MIIVDRMKCTSLLQFFVLKAEADKTNRGLDNSRYHAKTEFNNYFIIHTRYLYQRHANSIFSTRCLNYYTLFQKCFRCCWRQHIVRRRDIIVTEYQELFVDVTS